MRVPTCSLAKPGWRISGSDAAHTPRVIRNDLRAAWSRDDKDPGGTHRSGLAGVAAQPPGLLVRSAEEPVDVVVGFQQSWREIWFLHPLTKGDGRCMNSLSSGRFRAGRRLISSQVRCAFAPNVNSDRSASTRRAATVRFSTTKLVRSVPDAVTARSINARSSGVVRTSRRRLRLRSVRVAVKNLLGVYGHCTSTASADQDRAVQSNCLASVDPTSASVEERPPVVICITSSKYPAPTSAWCLVAVYPSDSDAISVCCSWLYAAIPEVS